MQTSYPQHMTLADAERLGTIRKEVFTGADDAEVQKKMDRRLKQTGDVLHERTPIEDLPLTIRDLSAECAAAHNRGQRKRLRKELHKLVDAL